ncbi:MAG: NYN domain-containing protein [Saprospiraceae bacterium]|nr:NYN domain-containing protein [Saprospiraceae bacterium]
MEQEEVYEVLIQQSVAVLIDGNNVEMSVHTMMNRDDAMVSYDTLVPRLLDDRALNRLIYFREGQSISHKLAERLHRNFHGSVVPCHKSADIPLTIKATQLAPKVDTIIIVSGDSDFFDLVRHLKGQGVRVEIAGVKHSTSSMLREEADYFHPILKDDCFVFSS